MHKQRLIDHLKEGYSSIKEASKLPPWLLPERSFAVVVDNLGEAKVLELSRCLNLPIDMTGISETGSLSAETWQQACLDWTKTSLVGDVVITLMESVERIMNKRFCSGLNVDIKFVFRILMVVAFAPFISRGRDILNDIAIILNSDANSPADMIKRYTDSVVDGHTMVSIMVNDCIDGYQDWSSWADLLQQLSVHFEANYKLVAITPPLSEELVNVLVEMFKEVPVNGA